MFAASLAVALLDTVIPLFIGRLVSLMEAPDRQAALTAALPMLLGMVALVLVVRPLAILTDVSIRHNALVPGATSLIRWQSHWHVVRQSWPFFQNDFAGRIANRVMQTASSLRESAMSSIRAVWYIGVYGVTAFGLMTATDWRLGVPIFMWFVGYVADPAAFRAAAARALARELGRPLARDGPRRRQLHEHPDRQAVRPHARRGRLRPRSHGRPLRRDAQAPRDDHAVPFLADGAERAAARQHGRHRHHALGPGRGRRGRCGHRFAAGLANRERGRLGQLGSHVDLREHRHGAGGHAVDRRAALRRRPCRRAAARRPARRDPIRELDLRLRPHRRGARRAEPESDDPSRRARRPRRPLGRRQVDAREPAAAAARHRVRPHHDRRPGHRARHAGDACAPRSAW